jgi:spore germination protein YaaH
MCRPGVKSLKFLCAAALILPLCAQVRAQAASQPKTLFYMTEGGPSERDFLAHKSQVDTLVPTWYSVDGTGLVYGEPNSLVLREAVAAHVQVIPIIALFDKSSAHTLLTDVHAQDEMNTSLIRECKRNGYDGFQFDFEDIMWTDRDALSSTVKRTVDALHKEHLLVQIAVVPNAPGYPGHTAFSKWIFEEWRAAFDLKALGESVDLLCLMTYDQHTRWTTPGPVGGWDWTTMNLAYALKSVPSGKLSLGIALYGYHWFTGDPGLDKSEKKPNPTAEYISYANAMSLRDSYDGKQQWDPVDHTAWFYFYRDEMREWIFFTDKQGFADRYNLASHNHLQGICAWVLGEEDPSIWTVLPEHK